MVNQPYSTDTLPRHALIFFTCIIFLSALFALPSMMDMIADTDPLWHLAAGDLIRANGAIPFFDPWSFTTENYQWLNISWAWDCALSYVREHFGWQSALALNAITIALMFCCIFIACTLRSRNLALSLLVLLLTGPLLVINMRPLQITNLMTIVWVLILGGVVRNQIQARWLAALPFLMVLWVNSHGGFVVGGILLATYFLQALVSKERQLARQLFITGLVTFAVLFLNPYHVGIIEAVWRPLTTSANSFITEWHSLSATPETLPVYFYIFLFLALPLQRKPKVLPAEYALCYFWMVMALLSTRHLTIFALISAPIMATALHQVWVQFLPRNAAWLAQFTARFNDRIPAMIALFLSVAAMLWFPSPMAGKLNYGQLKVPSLQPEAEFIQQHYPNARLMTHFNIAAIFAYETRGKIPVFMDPRNDTAFPPEVMADFQSFLSAEPGWEEMWDKYHLDGVVLPNTEYVVMDRFLTRRGWKMVFEGPTATIFMREKNAKAHGHTAEGI